MTRRLPPLVLATLCTVASVAVYALLGLLHQLQTISASFGYVETLPIVFWVGFFGSIAALITSAAAVFVLLRSRAVRTIKRRASIALAVSLVLLLARWPLAHGEAVAVGDSLLFVHALRVAIFAWLGFLLYALLSNYALERTDGRGFDASC